MSKVKDQRNEFKNLSKEELTKKLDELRQARFGIRAAVATGHVKDISQFKKLKKSIARALTYLKQQKDQRGLNE